MRKRKQLLVLCLIILGLNYSFAQVGIANANPQATLHVDGAKDNPVTGVPNASQAANDAVVTKTGQLGVGTISPETKLHVVAQSGNANRFSLIDAAIGTNQNLALALRNISPLATGNYSLLGFTNSGPTAGGAAWGMGTIRTGSTATNGSEEEFYVGNSLGGLYNERMRINTQGNVGINTPAPNPSALLELTSTTKGFLTTRMTTAQRDAINPKPEGLLIYNLDIHCMQYWNATKWVGDCNGSTPTNNTITDCTNAGYSGTYQQGVAMNNSTINIKVNVTQVGPWSITSNTVNGVTFSGSGNFTTTGVQTVTVTGSGTPVNSGTFNYTFSLGSSTCSRDVNYVASPSNTIADCTNAGYSGTYQQGVAMNNSTINIKVNVTQVGPWSITSNTVNGVTFSGSGNFTTTGVQTVTVTGSGTPINSGTFNYTFSLGSSTCSRDVTYVASSNPAIDPCTKSYLGVSDFPNTYIINGQPVYVTVSKTGNTKTRNGTGSSGCGDHTTPDSWYMGFDNTQGTITFTFSQPVSGVKFNNGGIHSNSNAGDQATVTAKNGSVDIPNPTLTTTQACNRVPTVIGNKVMQPGIFTVTNTVTSITITHTDPGPIPYSDGATFNIILCPTAQ